MNKQQINKYVRKPSKSLVWGILSGITLVVSLYFVILCLSLISRYLTLLAYSIPHSLQTCYPHGGPSLQPALPDRCRECAVQLLQKCYADSSVRWYWEWNVCRCTTELSSHSIRILFVLLLLFMENQNQILGVGGVQCPQLLSKRLPWRRRSSHSY